MSAKTESIDDEVIAELDRRWKAIETGHSTAVPNDAVERWLRTWGTLDFRLWSER